MKAELPESSERSMRTGASVTPSSDSQVQSRATPGVAIPSTYAVALTLTPSSLLSISREMYVLSRTTEVTLPAALSTTFTVRSAFTDGLSFDLTRSVLSPGLTPVILTVLPSACGTAEMFPLFIENVRVSLLPAGTVWAVTSIVSPFPTIAEDGLNTIAFAYLSAASSGLPTTMSILFSALPQVAVRMVEPADTGVMVATVPLFGSNVSPTSLATVSSSMLHVIFAPYISTLFWSSTRAETCVLFATPASASWTR